MRLMLCLNLTLRVDIRVLISISGYAEKRLRANAAKIHIVDIQYHTGHYSLVEKRRACYLD